VGQLVGQLARWCCKDMHVVILGVAIAAAASAALPVPAALARLPERSQQQAVAAEPGAPRDTWYVFKDGKVVWGTQHVRVESLPEGRRAFTIRTRMLTELFGTKQETTLRTELVIGPDLAPVSLKTDAAQLSGTSRIEGQVTDGGFVVTAKADDQVSTSTYAFNDELGLIADAALETWLHRLPSTTTKSRVRLLAHSSGSVSEVDVELVERNEHGSVWRIRSEGAPAPITMRLDAEGAVTEQVHRFPPMRISRHPDASEIALEHRRFPDREVLVFPVGRELPPLRRISELAVQLEWKAIEPKSFNLEDSRQSVRSLVTDEQGRTTAVVLVRRAAGTQTDCSIPVEGTEFARFLGDSDFIKPQDAEIVRTAKEIGAGVHSARAAAEAICTWVAKFIEPAMVAETLSGPEVLRRRVGKCTEYSTLFASLARSAGIPTRIVLGQRLFPGGNGMQWGGHMWNEVWVGEWIPVDASAGEFGGSPALLKFVHSDSVMGTQDIRWRLTESLAVAVLEVMEMPASADAADAPAVADGLHDGVWTNEARGIRFRLPDDSWRVEEQSAPGTLLLRLRPGEDKDPGASAMIHFTSFDLQQGVPPRMISQARINGNRASLESLEVQRDEETTVAGVPAHRTSFRGVPKGAPPLMVTELIWSMDGTGCLLNLIASEPLHEQWLPSLERIAASFEFLPG